MCADHCFCSIWAADIFSFDRLLRRVQRFRPKNDYPVLMRFDFVVLVDQKDIRCQEKSCKLQRSVKDHRNFILCALCDDFEWNVLGQF